MRRPPFVAGQFAAITMFFTAFGYFDDESNAATLRAWLVYCGVVVASCSIPDRESIVSGLVPQSERHINDWQVREQRRWMASG